MKKNKKIKFEIDNAQPHDEKAQAIDTTDESVEQKAMDFVKMHDRLPLNRREFLGAGIIQFAGFLTLPPFLKILGPQQVSRSAGVVCDAAKLSDLPALVTLNLAGGAGLSANWMPMNVGGEPLTSYSKMGWGSSPSYSNSDFANKGVFFAGSPFLAALKTPVKDPATLTQKTNFVGIAVRSQDDSSGNKFDITGLAKAAGLNGTLLSNMGTNNTVTGNNTQPAFLTPPAPLVVGGYNDLVGALSVSGSLSRIATRAPALFNTIQKLNMIQSQRYLNLNYGDQLEKLMVCRSKDNTNLVSSADGSQTDPLSNPQFAAIWGLTANTSKSSRDFIFATMVYNALKGNAGSANLTIGGFDYHNGTRTTGDAKDADAGGVVGRIIESANLLNKKTFVLVTSDGSVTSAESEVANSVWASDGGLRGSAMMFAVDPSGATTAKGSQLGHYLTAQAADDKTLVGASPERAAASMFANYMAFAQQIALFEKTLPRVFSTEELDKILMF